MDQDATWYRGRPGPTQHCVRCGPGSPSPKGVQPPIFIQVHYGQMAGWTTSYPQKKGHTHPHPILAHVYCGQTAGWIKMPLGTEVDLGPGHILLDGVPAPRKKGHSSPHVFSPCLLWPRSPISATAELLFSDIFSDLRCWFGVKKSIWPVKKLSDEVPAWLSIWSKVQTI